MAHLSKLKIVPVPVMRMETPEQARRSKLLMKLEEQLRMAEAELGGSPYERLKRVCTTDQNGDRKRIERPTRLKPWWLKDASGTTSSCS